MGGPGRVVYAGTLWSRLVKRTVTKDPYPFVSLSATGHLSRTVTPAGLKAWTKAQFSTSVADRTLRQYLDTDLVTFLDYLSSAEGKHKTFLQFRRIALPQS